MTDLEVHPRLDLVCQNLRDGLIEICHDLHGQLRLDATTTDEIVECIGKGDSEAFGMSVSFRRNPLSLTDVVPLYSS